MESGKNKNTIIIIAVLLVGVMLSVIVAGGVTLYAAYPTIQKRIAEARYEEHHTFTIRDEDGTILITNGIKKASPKVQKDSMNNQHYVVSLQFTSKVSKEFADLTERYLDRNLYFYLDENLIMAPRVGAVITTGECQLDGNFESMQDAKDLAKKLKSCK